MDSVNISRPADGKEYFLINGKKFRTLRNFTLTGELLRFADDARKGIKGVYNGELPEEYTPSEDHLLSEGGVITIITEEGEENISAENFALSLAKAIEEDIPAWTIENLEYASPESIKRRMERNSGTVEQIKALISDISKRNP